MGKWSKRWKARKVGFVQETMAVAWGDEILIEHNFGTRNVALSVKGMTHGSFVEIDGVVKERDTVSCYTRCSGVLTIRVTRL